MLRTTFIILVLTTLFTACSRLDEGPETPQWDVFELALNGPSAGNPYMEVALSAVFRNGDEDVTVPGFYDGDGIYRIRFSPDEEGTWTYETQSDSPELDGQAALVMNPHSGSQVRVQSLLETIFIFYFPLRVQAQVLTKNYSTPTQRPTR
jgi:hypothetical protein